MLLVDYLCLVIFVPPEFLKNAWPHSKNLETLLKIAILSSQSRRGLNETLQP